MNRVLCIAIVEDFSSVCTTLYNSVRKVVEIMKIVLWKVGMFVMLNVAYRSCNNRFDEYGDLFLFSYFFHYHNQENAS
jgi:hypothetical protein